MSRPRTRAYIIQETEDSKESLKYALYSPVKIEPLSKEISKCESTSSEIIKNRHCHLCNITFLREKLFLDHELHFHKTKETPVIDLKTLCCNICNKIYRRPKPYLLHMANLNKIHVTYFGKKRQDPSKTPDENDPNNYCISCDYTYKKRDYYRRHLIQVHRMRHIMQPLKRKRNPKDMKPKIDFLKMNCGACEKTFMNKESYIQHLVKIHKIILPDAYSKPSSFDLKNRYCKVCDQTYSGKKIFIAHVRNTHHTEPPSIFVSIPNAVKNQ